MRRLLAVRVAHSSEKLYALASPTINAGRSRLQLLYSLSYTCNVCEQDIKLRIELKSKNFVKLPFLALAVQGQPLVSPFFRTATLLAPHS